MPWTKRLKVRRDFGTAQANDYDVVILDLMLPRIDGLTVLKRLRAAKQLTHVLILTAKDNSGDRIIRLDSGTDDYLVKPFVFAELLARVRALVRRRYDAKSPLIQIADMEIDTVTRTVRRDGEFVELSGREYALLQFLALQRPSRLSDADLGAYLRVQFRRREQCRGRVYSSTTKKDRTAPSSAFDSHSPMSWLYARREGHQDKTGTNVQQLF